MEVWVVRLPGRASRLDEPAVADIPALADGIAGAMIARADLPFIFFGHSMGAVLAFEAAHALARHKAPMPRHLIVSGRRPPGVPGIEAPIHRLPDEAFIAAVGDRYGAIPAELMREPEVMALVLPGLRADFTALETFQPEPRGPLDCPVSVFGGVHDRLAPRAHLEAWRGQTTGPVRVRSFPGDHFYLNDQRSALLADLSAIAAPMLRDAKMPEAAE
jgi:surfactin synthase thioesterase subunit